MVQCPKCGSKRVSEYGSKWKCDMCRCIFTTSFSNNKDKVNRTRGTESEKMKEYIRMRKERNRRFSREKRLKREAEEREIRLREERERKQREKERIESIRKSREAKGIYVNKSLSLLKGCSRKMLWIIYNKINIPRIELKEDRLNYIATRYSTKDIEKMIKDAEDQIDMERRESEERERKQREAEEREKKLREEEYNRSVSILEECDHEVLDILTLNNLPSNIEERDKRIDLLAKKFKPTSLENRIAMAEREIEKKELEKAKWAVILLFLFFIAFFVVIMALNY